MIVKYKPSHKLSVFSLQAGLLQADSESMNLIEDVINRITIPIQLQFSYHQLKTLSQFLGLQRVELLAVHLRVEG